LLPRILDRLREGAILFDSDATVLAWNAAAARLTAVPAEKAVGARLAEVALAEPFARALGAIFSKALAGGEASATLQVSPSPGRTRVIRLEAGRIEAGSAVRVLAVLDARERHVKLGEEVLDQHKMRILGRLVGEVAHECNNNLAGILGYVSLLKEMTSGEPTVAEYTALVEKSAKRMADTTARVGSFARRRSARVEPMIVNFVVEEAIALAGPLIARKARLERTLAGNLPPVMGNPDRLEQAVLHLLIASHDAAPEGGALGVATLFVPDGPLERGSAPRPAVSVSVSHSGRSGEPAAGPMEENADLAAASSIVGEHGGTVDFEPMPGAAARLTIYLPAHMEAAGPEAN